MVSLLRGHGVCFVLEIAHRWEAWCMEACAGLDRVSNRPNLRLSRDILNKILNVECF